MNGINGNGEKYITWKDWSELQNKITATIKDVMSSQCDSHRSKIDGRLRRLEKIMDAGQHWLASAALLAYRIAMVILVTYLTIALNRSDLLPEILKIAFGAQ